jgi:hypothetical protein
MSIADGCGDIYFYAHMIKPSAQMSFTPRAPENFPSPIRVRTTQFSLKLSNNYAIDLSPEIVHI